MSENDEILIGKQEIATFMRISIRSLQRMRDKHPDIPLYQDGARGQLCADKMTLANWQRTLYSKPMVAA